MSRPTNIIKYSRKEGERKRTYSETEDIPFPHNYELDINGDMWEFEMDYIICCICGDNFEQHVHSYTLGQCRHNFCIDCLRWWIRINNNELSKHEHFTNTKCPICKCKIEDYILEDFLKRSPMELTKKLQDNALKLNNWKCGWEETKEQIRNYKYKKQELMKAEKANEA